MAGPLVVCVACSSHVLTSDKACPHCGASLHDSKGRVLGRTTTAVLMGLALAGCPADDDSSDSMGAGSSSSSATTEAASSGSAGTSSTPATGTTDDSGSTALTFDNTSGAQAAYGSPDTETFGSTDVTDSDTTSSGGDTDTDTDTDTDSDTDLGTTSAAPLYGAAPSDE